MPVPVAARSKAWVCGRSLDGRVSSNPAGESRWCLGRSLLVTVLCCEVEVSASFRGILPIVVCLSVIVKSH
jgi:hypothetical protein